MKKQLAFLILCMLMQHFAFSQYTLWSIGNAADTVTQPKACTLLMGGATEDDQAMKKFLQYADHGDIVVIRTSGADGYNNYLYSQLGVYVNSVQTLLIPGVADANDSFVVQTVRNAEALWIAGGDQWTYISNWKNTALNNAINYLVNVRKVPVGGTSAGMAVMGEYYNSAQGGSAQSATVLANPYDASVTIGSSDFIHNTLLDATITDTHFDNPDRRGRLMTFLARTWKDSNVKINAIACDEYTSVFIDSNFKATVYGGGTAFDDNAYFVRVDCAGNNAIENCTSGNALNWKQDSSVVKVYHIQSDSSGTQYFDLRNFGANPVYANNGGSWQDWWVSNGTFHTKSGTAINCIASAIHEHDPNIFALNISPNPFQNKLHITCQLKKATTLKFDLKDITGNIVFTTKNFKMYADGFLSEQICFDKELKTGVYLLQITDHEGSKFMYKIIKD